MRGHIRRRSPGSFEIIFELGRDPQTGRRKQQSVSYKGNKKGAEARLSELLHQLDTGMMVKPQKLTVSDFLRLWLHDYAATQVRARTLEGYTSIVETHLIPGLGAIGLMSLTPAHVQRYEVNALQNGGKRVAGSGLSARTVLSHHRLLSKALATALQWGIVNRNVALAVRPPHAAQQEMQTIDGEGIELLLRTAEGTPYRTMIHLAVFTGLRRSELLGLRWRNVDLDLASLSVVECLHQLRGGRLIFEPPKTRKSARNVALSPVAVLALRDHREQQEVERGLYGGIVGPDAHVFAHAADGSPIYPNTLTHAFSKIATRAGLAHLRFHELRHTHASIMLKQGVHPKIVSERLGHSTVGITLDTYSHVLPGLQEAAALRFDEGLTTPHPIQKDYLTLAQIDG